MSDQIKNAISTASEISSADYVPDEFREMTYELVLNHLLGKEGQTNSDSRDKNSSNSNDTSRDLKNWEENIIENLPSASVAAKGNRDQQTIWAVITLYSTDQVANRDSVRNVIKDELGVTPQSKSNTSHKLKNLVPDYLSRTKDGKGYFYEPTRNSLKLFQNNSE